jgi:hypothetical protein
VRTDDTAEGNVQRRMTRVAASMRSEKTARDARRRASRQDGARSKALARESLTGNLDPRGSKRACGHRTKTVPLNLNVSVEAMRDPNLAIRT